MIGHLKGVLIEKHPPTLILDVNGIGYEIHAPMSTFYHLPDLHQNVSLYTHLVVRDDAHILYGFHCDHDRRLFRALIKVNGVGPKSALTILSGIEPEKFIHCIMNHESAQLLSIPGIGRKTVERLIVEMKDSLSTWGIHSEHTSDECINSLMNDALSALIALGYKPKEAQQAISQVSDINVSTEELIRRALKTRIKEVPS